MSMPSAEKSSSIPGHRTSIPGHRTSIPGHRTPSHPAIGLVGKGEPPPFFPLPTSLCGTQKCDRCDCTGRPRKGIPRAWLPRGAEHGFRRLPQITQRGRTATGNSRQGRQESRKERQEQQLGVLSVPLGDLGGNLPSRGSKNPLISRTETIQRIKDDDPRRFRVGSVHIGGSPQIALYY